MDPLIEIASQTTSQLIKDSLDRIYGPISSFLTVNRAKFFEKFDAYCDYMVNKSNLVRTLYSKNKPVELYSIYVRTRFSTNGTKRPEATLTDTDIITKFSAGDRIIIKGHGGSGKTIFLKHLWLSRFRKSEGRIPIFVELRRLNELQSLDIKTFCRSELQADVVFDSAVFEKLCDAGKFEFIFDGFDEVAREKRKSVERQIMDLSEKYRKCCFLVSGREDERFSSWGSFEIFTVAPLSLDDVKILIDKIPFDKKVKKKFKDTLDQNFYNLHYSFLSSPLLAIMMLMTFNENAIIPSKLTSFYNSAFQTLLTWHDATKDSFDRERCLSVDQFRKVFSTICLISYYDQVFEFDENQIRKYIDKSLRYHGQQKRIDDVLNDICESVNLLQREGFKYIFVHRSFQEYFAAECAMQIISGKSAEFLEAFAKRPRDSVFFMCYEIHPELVYDTYLDERIKKASDTMLFKPKSSYKFQRIPLIVESFDVEWVAYKNKLRFHGIGYSDCKALREVMSFLELCSYMSDGNPWPDAFLVYQSIIHPLETLINEDDKRYLKGTSITVALIFSFDDISISIRNTGETKLSAREINALKRKIRSEISPLLTHAEERIAEGIKYARDFFEKIKHERQTKEKSIDEILGLE